VAHLEARSTAASGLQRRLDVERWHRRTLVRCDNGIVLIDGVIAETRTLAEAAGNLTLEWFRRTDLAVDRKADGSEVTAADREAERHIREYLSKHHPDDAVLGEEEGVADGTSGRRWIIDPIDGTRGFVRGVPLYSTLIALVDDEGPLAGVIRFPALDITISAGRAGGCWVGDHRCSVSDTATLNGALMNTSDFETFSVQQFSAARDAGIMMRTWGDAYGYFLVATGQAEAMIDPICSTWDLAPMPLIIGEAGGRFTSIDGAADYTLGSGVATNGVLHEAVLGVLDTGGPHD
jgi:histidinol-phosphatase